MKTNLTPSITVLAASFFMLLLASCSGSGTNTSTKDSSTSDEYVSTTTNTRDMGIGPVTAAIDLGPIDATKADQGKQLFEAKCVACHNVTDERLVGPGLHGVTTRREPEWIMNQILNPTEMTSKDSIAKSLLETYLTQMTNQNVTEDQARNILEYFRQNDASK